MMTDIKKYNVPFEYRGYTIDLDKEVSEPRYLLYPSVHREPQHDHDYIDERYVYRGNCKFHDTISDCIHEIDQMLKIDAAPELLHAVGEMLISLNRSSCNWNLDTEIERAYKLCKDAYKKATQ